MDSGDAEHLLELNNELPVIVAKVILEVLLQGVDRVAGY